jgi:hypothetical protein
MTGTVGTSETSIYFNKTTWRYIPKGWNKKLLFTLRIIGNAQRQNVALMILKADVHTVTTPFQGVKNNRSYKTQVNSEWILK